MNSRCSYPPESLFNSSSMVSEDRVVRDINRPVSHTLVPSFWTRMAMRISRARWFGFLRQVFHYQNGARSGTSTNNNPLDSRTWMMVEFIALVVQITITTSTLVISKRERPLWPIRIWTTSYDIACLINLLLLYGRYRHKYFNHGDTLNLSHLEQHHTNNEQTRIPQLMNKCKTSLEIFFAIWFVMGNVWIFDSSRFGYFNQAPKLHVFCITLLGWNAICYSFPLLLFLLFCCCVPLISRVLGYNMLSSDKGASDYQISQLPSWTHNQVNTNLELGIDSQGCEILTKEDSECCICLAKYKNKEEVRELPCSHIFHQKCVDQWLKIISFCPLCKQGLERTK